MPESGPEPPPTLEIESETALEPEPEPGLAPNVPEALPESDSDSDIREFTPEMGRGKRIKVPKVPFEEKHSARSAISRPPIPKSYEEAVSDPLHGVHWRGAVKDEIDKLQSMKAWRVTELPPGRKAVGCRWVFAVKYTPTGHIARYKARLVAQGFSQAPGVDFTETFSPTLKLDSLRTMLAIACARDLEVHQLDVVNAYIAGKLTEEIYMRPPTILGLPLHLVLLLLQAMYGLKQSGRVWYQEISKTLKKLGFYHTESDWSMFVNADKSLIIGVYVDDMVIMGKELRAIEALKAALTKAYPIKDMGEIGTCLGIRITRNRSLRTLELDQEAYLLNVLADYSMENCNPVATPVEGYANLLKSTPEEPRTDQNRYMSIVGSINYAALATRPDLAYIASQLAQHCADPSVRHYNAANRVLRYIKGALTHRIIYHAQGRKPLQGYSDADYGGAEDRHSISAYLFQLQGGAIAWSSKRQRLIVTSTTESEYIALCTAAKQGIWLRNLLYELGYENQLPAPGKIHLLCDNQGALSLANNPENHQRTKHIDVQYHYTRELVESGALTTDYCPTASMLADALTKPLSRGIFTTLIPQILGAAAPEHRE